jgi:ABC-type sugar transport system ATPase subunit
MSIGFSDLLARRGMIPLREEGRRLRELLASHGIKARGIRQPVGTLSGGNQQKAVLARWLARDPQLIILDEPTRGVDVGAKAEIHALIDRLAAAGKGICMISSDLPELLAMSDRILVFHEGRIAGELRGAAMTQERVLLAASGLAGAAA